MKKKEKLPIVYYFVRTICDNPPKVHEGRVVFVCGQVTEHFLNPPVTFLEHKEFKQHIKNWPIPACSRCGHSQSLTSELPICHIDGCYDPDVGLKPICKPPLHFLCTRHGKYVRKELTAALATAKSVCRIALQVRTLAEVSYFSNGMLIDGPLLEDSERWRRVAILRGEGDPLAAFSKIDPPA